jgi:hypothetical protein
MTTTEAIKHGTSALAETTLNAVTDLAEKAKSQAESAVGAATEKATEKVKDKLAERQESSHRGRRFVLGAALVGAAVGAFRYLRRTSAGRQVEERIIDLTHSKADESAPTAQGTPTF